jgi:dTDP-4-amino-4,6-dideoxygalactose transaminase
MTDIHAAIGRVQLSKLAGWTATRQRHAKVLDAGITAAVTPPVADGAVHVYHQYTVRVEGDGPAGPGSARDAFAAKLAGRGVGSGVYYPVPIHRLPSFGLDLDLPETERAAREVLSLPVHPALTETDLETIVAAVNA